MANLWKRASLGTVLLALALGMIVGASAQVFPVRWQETPEPEASAASSGSVVIGDGGLSLFPDVTSERGQAGSVFFQAGVQIVTLGSCTASNRGELRLGVVEKVNLQAPPNQIDVDALCLCRMKTTGVGSGSPDSTFAWTCFNSNAD